MSAGAQDTTRQAAGFGAQDTTRQAAGFGAQDTTRQTNLFAQESRQSNPELQKAIDESVQKTLFAMCEEVFVSLLGRLEQQIEVALDEHDKHLLEVLLEKIEERENEKKRFADENNYLTAFDTASESGAIDASNVPQAPDAEMQKEERWKQYRQLIDRIATDFKKSFFQEWSATLRAQRPFMNPAQRNLLKQMIAERFGNVERQNKAQTDALWREIQILRNESNSLKHIILQHTLSNSQRQTQNCATCCRQQGQDFRQTTLRQENSERHAQEDLQAIVSQPSSQSASPLSSPLSSPPLPFTVSPPLSEWPGTALHRSPTPP